MFATHRASTFVTLAALAAALLAIPLLAPTPPRCVPIPIEPSRDTSCDDGTPLLCDMAQPACRDHEILAIQDGCWVCVNPETCVPWGVPECRSDLDCPPDEFCNPCGTGSCPVCLDCVAACTPHGCATEPEPACNLIRPDCGEGRTAVVRDGCWVCVDLHTCEPARDTSCDDGTEPMCLRPPPVCNEWEILAHQDHCYRCVNPATCLPWGEAECRHDAECPAEERCDRCGTSSCPPCDDCLGACVAHGCPTEAYADCDMVRPACGEGQVAVVRDGCWVCVWLDSCEPVAPPEVRCGTSVEVFPDFSKRCEANTDCAVVFHLINCCGTEVAWGIRADEAPGFEEAEAACRSQMAHCGCPAFPTEADDGNTHWDHTAFAVRCQENRCFSYVRDATVTP